LRQFGRRVELQLMFQSSQFLHPVSFSVKLLGRTAELCLMSLPKEVAKQTVACPRGLAVPCRDYCLPALNQEIADVGQ